MKSLDAFPVIGIGASAGGINAFHSFFEQMPADCGMAFVMILHLPVHRKSMLIDILSRWTSMPVVEGADGTRIEPNHIYVPAPHAFVSLSDGRLAVELSAESSERQFRPIDGFFDSLGAAMHERAVGIVLSGTGSDGALGLKSIKEYGGLTIAQGSDGTSPQYGEMPARAIATGAVDIVAPVEQIPAQLIRFKQARVDLPKDGAGDGGVEAVRLEICSILKAQLGHDFSGYRSQSFLRRVARRMQVVNARTVEDYTDRLRSDPAEIKFLFRDLLIQVTSFFRDQATFDVLASKVNPQLFEGKMADSTVRVWVPGCATGEEAYSLAILLREHLDLLSLRPKVQLFGTDIDESAISTARLGLYPKTLLDGLSDARRERFFTPLQGRGYCVAKEIRELCTFSPHDLTRDPPFSMMNLVSCRNLLIYMTPDLQARVLPIFHYSLTPGGFLLLGEAESVAHYADLFETVDKASRIFRRREGRSPELAVNWRQSPLATIPRGDPQSTIGRPASSVRLGASFERSAMARPFGYGGDQFRHLLEPLPPTAEAVTQVQSALKSVYEELRSLSEEHQTALEELRSSNEELQSANEELETSKEELQSLNEELRTVNLRLTEKIDELDRNNSDLRNLFESTQIATVFLDRHLIIRSFTPAIAALYNLIPSDNGRPLTDIVSRLQYPSLREDVECVLSTMAPLERRVIRDDRTAHYVLRILPYRQPDGAVTGVLMTFLDVTNIVRAEEALVEADVRKDVFLATLSHELRNPLAPIRIAAQLLQSPRLPPNDLDHVQSVIARQVRHMTSLLDDLLDVSRITRASFVLKKRYVDIQMLMDDAVEAARPAIEAKGHTLRIERPTAPLLLEVDPVRITQVITNLLTNAAKYTSEGGLIYLGTRMEPKHIVVLVRDNGIGLAPETMGKVFDMFTRVDGAVSRAEGGLGIGLALAKGLIELHGGQLKVHSAGLGQGSEFMACIPRALMVVAPPLAAVSGEETAVSLVPKRILIADDNRDSATTLCLLLKLSGHEVYVAHSGAAALETAQQARPEVAIVDIGMPDLSGYEVAERLRHEAWGQAIRLIALTGWGQDADRRRALAAGFDHHVTKPVDPRQLEALIGA